MKKIKVSQILLILLLTACAQAPLKMEAPQSELEAMLSTKDLKIHRCLNSGKTLNIDLKKECLAGTAYESFLSRSPSSDDVMIMKNNWFFDSKENVQKFYKASRGFLRAQSLLARKAAGRLVNKKGIAVEGSYYAGVGRGWAAEFAVHQLSNFRHLHRSDSLDSNQPINFVRRLQNFKLSFWIGP